MAGAAAGGMVLRLRTGQGHSRISVSPDASVAQLHARVAEHLKINPANIGLFRDAAYTERLQQTDAQHTVQQAGLHSGSEVFVLTTGGAEVYIAAAAAAPPHRMSTADLSPLPAAAKNGKKSSTGGEGEGSAGGAKASDVSGSSSSSSSSAAGAAAAAAGGRSAAAAGETGKEEAAAAGGKRSSSPSPAAAAAKGSGVGPGTTFKSFGAFLRERNFSTRDLPGMRSYKPVKLEAGKMNKLPPAITLGQLQYRHVDHLEMMNVEEVQNFVHFWQYDLQMLQQRFGFMFGYYVEDPHYPDGIRAVCEAIYEPPQDNTLTDIRLLETAEKEELKVAEQLAERLGLELIGCIFTHAPREELLTASEVLRLAKYQLERERRTHFTGYPLSNFVCCTISLDQQAGEGGEAVANAFMVSDLITALVRDNVVAEKQPDDSHLLLREPEQGELMPQILESGRETKLFDVSWTIVRVNESAPKKVRSFFKYNCFPRENRLMKATPRDITEQLTRLGSSNKAEDSWKKFSDFHLLLYIAELFDVPTALTLCDAVKEQQPVNAGLEEILKSLG